MGRPTKKSILKQKKHSSLTTEAMAGYSELLFVKLLQSLPMDDLKNMKKYFEHDKTVLSKKMEAVVEYSPTMKVLMKVHEFMGDMIDKGRTLIHDAVINDACAKNAKGEFKSSDVVKMIDKRIAVKENEMEL